MKRFGDASRHERAPQKRRALASRCWSEALGGTQRGLSAVYAGSELFQGLLLTSPPATLRNPNQPKVQRIARTAGTALGWPRPVRRAGHVPSRAARRGRSRLPDTKLDSEPFLSSYGAIFRQRDTTP